MTPQQKQEKLVEFFTTESINYGSKNLIEKACDVGNVAGLLEDDQELAVRFYDIMEEYFKSKGAIALRYEFEYKGKTHTVLTTTAVKAFGEANEHFNPSGGCWRDRIGSLGRSFYWSEGNYFD